MFNPVQTTTSYRSSGAEATDEELIKEFTTVTRNSRKPNLLYDNGHPFETSKDSFSFSHPDWDMNLPTEGLHYRGPLVLAGPSSSWARFPAANGLTGPQLNAFGARAINATAPTKPQANLFTAVGELTFDGLPKLIGHSADFAAQANHFRSLGSEYLNVTFGWMPFVSDLLAVVRSLRNASSIILQLERDATRWVRRGFRIDPEFEEVSQSTFSSPNGALIGLQGTPAAAFFSSGRQSRTTVSTSRYRELYFKGCYTYHFETATSRLDEIRRFLDMSDKLLGTALTPEALWNLAPWSWLVDWYGNIGQVLGNASLLSTDALVLRYGYVMCLTRERNTYSNPDIHFKTGGPGTVTNTFTRLRKERFQAGPYGFGFTTADLTPRQWSILAALGLTKSPRSLRGFKL